MKEQILALPVTTWRFDTTTDDWITALEAGKVLHFPQLAFELEANERRLLEEGVAGAGDASLDDDGRLTGMRGDAAVKATLAAMIGRFRVQARQLVDSLAPSYRDALRAAPTKYRAAIVDAGALALRADDRRMNIDVSPSRPTHGERILRVFSNIHPEGEPRTWRIGEPFDVVARHFLPRVKPYLRWQARLLHALRVTASPRSEYDHLMLQLHDIMRFDMQYQQNGRHLTVLFPAGSTWVCFSDQVVHAAMSGQHLLEQTFHLPVVRQADPQSSPLGILERLTGRKLV